MVESREKIISTSDAGEEEEEAGISPAKDSCCLWDPSTKSLFDGLTSSNVDTMPLSHTLLWSWCQERSVGN